jgi:hypothetical protein
MAMIASEYQAGPYLPKAIAPTGRAGENEICQQAGEHRCDAAEQAAGRAGGAGGDWRSGGVQVHGAGGVHGHPPLGRRTQTGPLDMPGELFFAPAAWRQVDLW